MLRLEQRFFCRSRHEVYSINGHSYASAASASAARMKRSADPIHPVGMLRDGSVPLPFRQQDMADALGLSLVHTNKTVARLKERGLAVWQSGRLVIPDMKTLALAAGVADERAEIRPIL